MHLKSKWRKIQGIGDLANLYYQLISKL